MRTKGIAFVLSVVMAMLILSCAFAADASDLQLGMSKKEVLDIMGKGSDTISKNFPTNFDTLSYPDQKISKFDDSVLVLYFDNDILVSKMYTFEETSTIRTDNNYGYLLNALTGKYGEPEPEADIKLLQNFFEMFSGKKADIETLELLIKANYAVIKNWNVDDTTILLVNIISGKDEALTAIQYTQKDISMPETVYNDSGL